MLLLEKNIFVYSNVYLFILINRQSIHPIDTYVHQEAYDFTLEDLEDIILGISHYLSPGVCVCVCVWGGGGGRRIWA